jgi:hypothetical protein
MRMIPRRRSIRWFALMAGIAVLCMEPDIEATPRGARLQEASPVTPASPALPAVPVVLSPIEAKGPWIGPDGEVLAFRTGDEIAAFLRTARVVSLIFDSLKNEVVCFQALTGAGLVWCHAFPAAAPTRAGRQAGRTAGGMATPAA